MVFCPICGWDLDDCTECDFVRCPVDKYRCPDCEWEAFETPDGNRKWVNVKPCSRHVLIGEAVPLTASGIVKKWIINFLKILFFIVAIGLGIIGLGIAMGGIGIVGLGIVDYLSRM